MNALVFLLSAAYPLGLWLLWDSVPRFWFVVPILLVLVIRNASLLLDEASGPRLTIPIALIFFVVIGFAISPEIASLAYPVAINLLMMIWFGQSLRANKVPVVERLARLKEPDIDSRGVYYTRQVTKLWCVVFALTAIISAYTVYLADPDIWLFFNGIVVYVIVGFTFAGEYVFRQWYRRQ